MTRLIEAWISDIENDIEKYELDLKEKLGYGLLSIAAYSAEISEELLREKSKHEKVFIIQVTSGLGVIGHFAESVRAIIAGLGFDAYVTNKNDIAGLYEAALRGGDIVFLADDNEFIALNIKTGNAVNNDLATAKGFFGAFCILYDKLNGEMGNQTCDNQLLKLVLVGFGTVGSIIAELLEENGFEFDLLEKSFKKKDEAKNKGINLLESESDLVNYDIIFDASCEGGFINKEMIKDGAWFIGPGVPISLDNETAETMKDRIVHDYLPIGVATMLAMANKMY